DSPQITRVEGKGNGGIYLDLTQASETQIIYNYFADYPVYQAGYGPVEVKVVDPLNVAPGTYTLQFIDTTTATPSGNTLNDAYWRLIFPSLAGGYDTVMSDVSIASRHEQLFLDQ